VKTASKPSLLAIDGGTPVRTQPLPWSLPGVPWIGGEELELVSQVIRAQSPFRYYGPNHTGMADRLEREWCERFGCRHALAVNSGTAALHIGLLALGIGPGDEVLVPGFMWVSCLSAIVRTGAIPRLVDIDESYNMDPDDLRAKIGPHSKAVLLVHMLGATGRLNALTNVARQSGLYLLEDCAQALGASYQGVPVGGFGDVAVFSFQLNKNLTSGEGGMIHCNDSEIYNRCYAIHDLGYIRNNEGRLASSDHHYKLWGVGSRMSELTAAFLLAQVRRLDLVLDDLRQTKRRLSQALSDMPNLRFRPLPDPAGDSCQSLTTVFEERNLARRMAEALRAEGIRGPNGSAVLVHTDELVHHWYFKNSSLTERCSNASDGFPWSHPANGFAREYSYESGTLPCCDSLSQRTLLHSLSCRFEPRDIEDIIAAYRKVSAALLHPDYAGV